MVSQNASYFVNTMFGWPMLPSADLPGGGPAYPLSASGVRGCGRTLTDTVTILAGVFNGSPSPNNDGDPQKSEPSAELPAQRRRAGDRRNAIRLPGSGTMVKANEEDPLARTYKLGVWYDSEDFADQRYDNTGLSLADPEDRRARDPSRRLRDLRGRGPDDLARPKSRIATSTSSSGRCSRRSQDRNLIDFSLNAGLAIHEPFLGRDDDTAGIGVD